jgi:hypothetical protein
LRAVEHAAAPTQTRVTSLLGVLARAGAMGRGQPEGHVERTCYIGMRIADELKLSEAERADVFFSTLLVHAGARPATRSSPPSWPPTS